MKLPTHDEIRDAHHQGEDTTIQLFDRTFQDVQEIQAELQALKDQLNQIACGPPHPKGWGMLRGRTPGFPDFRNIRVFVAQIR